MSVVRHLVIYVWITVALIWNMISGFAVLNVAGTVVFTLLSDYDDEPFAGVAPAESSLFDASAFASMMANALFVSGGIYVLHLALETCARWHRQAQQRKDPEGQALHDARAPSTPTR